LAGKQKAQVLVRMLSSAAARHNSYHAVLHIIEEVFVTYYTAIGLTAGTTYVLTVESRNSYGFSVVSEEITLLCAFVPEPPLIVTTSNLND
jgi:hypothetical protein